MFYEKRFVILTGKNDEKGSVKLVRRGDSLTAAVNAFGLDGGDYLLIVSDDGKRTDYPLGRLEREVKVELDGDTNAATAHFTVSGDNGAELYGTLNKRRLWWGNLPGRRMQEIDEAAVENDSIGEVEEKKTDVQSIVPDIFPASEGYDDNAVATVNYYQEAVTAALPDEVKRDKKTDAKCGSEVRGRKATFYERVGEQIERLMTEGERMTKMEQRLPFTRWVRINYGGGRHYIIGVIGEKPDFVCYGVPGVYSPTPPSALGEQSLFLPRDEVRPQGEGYWLLYQSADTGESVLPG